MYDLFRTLILRLARAPLEPPDPPAGSQGSVDTFRASKKLLTLQLIGVGFGAVFVLPVLAFSTFGAFVAEDVPLPVVALFALTFVFLCVVFWFRYVLVRLDYDMRYYIVTDRSMRIREGSLSIHEHTYTFANIQNLTIEQGPLERMLGIANLRIQTAGGGGVIEPGRPGGVGHGGTLRGIEDAEAVRDRILGLLKAYRDAGLGDRDEKAGPTPSSDDMFVQRLREVRDEVRGLGRALDAAS